MKLMFASDIHGSRSACERVLERYDAEGADRLILLGDLLYHGPRNDLPESYAPKAVIALLNARKNELLCVRGNCEAEVDQMVLEFPVMADYMLLPLLSAYPISELILHPRTRTQFYRGQPHREIFVQALSSCPVPLCYNGDLFTPDACEEFMDEYPRTRALMLGRGLVANPALAQTLAGGAPLTVSMLRGDFADRTAEEISAQFDAFTANPAATAGFMLIAAAANMGLSPSSSSGISSFHTITALATSETSAPQPITPPKRISASASTPTVDSSMAVR